MKSLNTLKITAAAAAAALLCGCGNTFIKPSGQEEPPAVHDETYTYLVRKLDTFLTDGYVLPETDGHQRTVEWSVAEGDASISGGVISKTEAAAEYEQIVLNACIDGNNYEIPKLLLDPYAGYVITYFTPEGEDGEKLKLAYTFDSLYWYKLNEDQPVLSASLGTKRLRDPSAVRKKDGSFALLATQGYDNDSIYVFDTEDFITYENERLLKVNASSSELKMSESAAWAPEAFYNPAEDNYVIYWSSVPDGGMYYNTSSDLQSISYPKVLFDTGYEVIDGTIIKTDGEYVLIGKDERQPMEEYSQIFRATSSVSDWRSFDTFENPVYDRHQVEGPMVMRSLYEDYWFIYVDDYTRGQYHGIFTKDLVNGEFLYMWEGDLLIPMEHPAHSYALPVTWKELERLINAYGS